MSKRGHDPSKPKSRLFDFHYFLYDVGKLIAFLPGLLWLRPKWYFASPAARKPIRGGAILMFNHIGFADPIYAQFAVGYRRQHFVAATELFQGKVRRRLFRIFHCIEIDRANFNFGSFRSILSHLNAGKVVSIYPEGHINSDSRAVASFKSGVVMMALQSDCPVIPVYVQKSGGFWSRAKFCIGEPIFLKEQYGKLPSLDQIEKISQDLRNKEQQLCELLKQKENHRHDQS